MDKENIYGVFEYKGKEYPFALDGQILTIPQAPFQFVKDFDEASQIEAIQGVTSNNRDIVFVGCDVIENGRTPFSTEVKLTILGYILLESEIDQFDEIRLQSEAINVFYSPRFAYDVEWTEDKIGTMGIKLRDRALYKRECQCKIDGEDIQIGLDISIHFNLSLTEDKLGSANTVFSMSFPEKKKPYDILKYYLYVRDFLEFVNFRKDIPLKEILLFDKTDTGKYRKCGRAVIFQPDSSGYQPNLVKSITYIDITAECFPALFQQISEKRLKDARNPFLCPESRSDDKTVDASKWLNTAICFEGEFNEAFPNYRAKNDLSFHQAKSLLLSTIDDAVEESGFGINHKQNKNLKSFKNLIERSDTTIKQKFEVSQANYREETADAINNICRICGISEDVDLAEEYASYRNHTEC